jgi:glutamate-1-semialdehyde 2,1-aminomutase
MPCSPSISFALEGDAATAKALMIRGMIQRGFLMSSQLYVTWSHTEELVRSMIAALEETLLEMAQLHEAGAWDKNLGQSGVGTGFARLV